MKALRFYTTYRRKVSLLHTCQQTPGSMYSYLVTHSTAGNRNIMFSLVPYCSPIPAGVMRRWAVLDAACVVGCVTAEETQA